MAYQVSSNAQKYHTVHADLLSLLRFLSVWNKLTKVVNTNVGVNLPYGFFCFNC